MNTGTGNDQIVKLDGSAKLPAVDASALTNLNPANLSTVVPVAKGGTGQSSFTNGQLLIGNTTGNTLAKATLTAGTGITITNGAGSITIDSTGLANSLADGKIWVGQTGTPTAVTPSGDVAMTNAGLTTVNAVKGKTVSAAPTLAGQMLRYDGTNWTPAMVGMQDLRSNVTGTTALASTCAADKTLTYNSASDNLTCTTIAIAGTQLSGNIAGNAAGFTGSLVGDVSGTQGATSVDKIKGVGLDMTGIASGNFLKYDGTNWIPASLPAGNAGTVTSVTSANADIGVATTTSTPVLTLNTGTGNNQIVKLDGSAKLPAVDGSALTNLNASNLSSGTLLAARMPALTGDITSTVNTVGTTLAKVQGVTLTVSALATGNILQYDGTIWKNVADTTFIKASQIPASCAADKTLTFSSPTGAWTCSSIAITGSAFGSQSQNFVLAAPTGSAGNPTFRALAASDLPAGIASQWTTNSTTIYYNTGNVGIGTTNPLAQLHIAAATPISRMSYTDSAAAYSQYEYGRTGATAPYRWATGVVSDSFSNTSLQNAFYIYQRSDKADANINTYRMVIDNYGNVGIGTTNPGVKLSLLSTSSATSGTTMSSYFQGDLSPSSASTATHKGAQSYVFYNGSANSPGALVRGSDATVENISTSTVGTMAGAQAYVGNTSTGTISSAAGISATVNNSIAGGTISSASASYFDVTKAAGTITNGYGVLIGPIQATNNWGLYQSDATAKNYFAGNVGIGTTTPRGGLEVSSAIVGKAATANGTTTVNFALGNLQYTSLVCQTFNLNNMKDGASYTLGIQNTTSGTCAFNAFSDAGSTALTVHLPPDHAATDSGKHTIYTFLVLGTHVYVSWITGY